MQVDASLEGFRFPDSRAVGRAPRRAASKSRWSGILGLAGVGTLRLSVLAGLAGCIVFAGMSDFGAYSAPVRPLWPALERGASAVGLGVDQVSISGHHHTLERDIFDALKLEEQRSFLSFDSNGALSRLEKLAWVKSASIVRVLPGQLEIKVVEREAFALWRRGDELSLIDVHGGVLSALDIRFAPKLPMVVGEGAALEVAPLMRAVASSKFVASRMVKAERVSRRRWSLFLTEGVVLHLPAQGMASALALIGTHRKLQDLISLPNTVLDLRVSGRVAVRNGGGGATSVFLSAPREKGSGRGPG